MVNCRKVWEDAYGEIPAGWQIHHIIPKHRNGKDILSNLVAVPLEQHFDLHYSAWQENEKIQDLLAANSIMPDYDKFDPYEKELILDFELTTKPLTEKLVSDFRLFPNLIGKRNKGSKIVSNTGKVYINDSGMFVGEVLSINEKNGWHTLKVRNHTENKTVEGGSMFSDKGITVPLKGDFNVFFISRDKESNRVFMSVGSNL